MNPFEMVVMLVLIGVAGGVLRTWLNNRHAAPVDNGPEITAREERIAQLEARVAALEAVVADQGYELRKQFRDLERV